MSKNTQTTESAVIPADSLFGSIDRAKGQMPKISVEGEKPVYTSPRTATDLDDATDKDESANSEDHPSDDKDSDSTDWKKRYDDLKRHYDKSIVPLRDELTEKEGKLKELSEKMKESSKPDFPKSKEELEQMAKKYPDIYQAIISIARMEVLENASKSDEKLEEVNRKLKEIEKKELLLELSEHHPDAGSIKNSPDFLDWYENQTPTMKALFNSSNIQDLIEGLNIYKSYKGIKTPSDKKKDKVKDATLVDTKGKVNPTDSGKKTWYESEVAKMSSREFAKYEKEIDAAMAEGRFVRGA